MKTLTSQSQRDQIKETIQTELSRRGFHAPIVSLEEVSGRYASENRIEFQTENFQTAPILFKSINISNFSSGISNEETYENSEIKFRGVWIVVSAKYESFSGGSNGTNLFDFRCDFVEGENRICNVQIS